MKRDGDGSSPLAACFTGEARGQAVPTPVFRLQALAVHKQTGVNHV
jgi:hypothetical protein